MKDQDPTAVPRHELFTQAGVTPWERFVMAIKDLSVVAIATLRGSEIGELPGDRFLAERLGRTAIDGAAPPDVA